MLAKIWKKLLLAICIIAVLFNITSKLVNRISLEKAISSTPEGVNLREVLNITDDQRTTSSSSNHSNSSVSQYKTVEEVEAERAAQKETEQEAFEQENVESEVVETEIVEEEIIEEPKEKNTGGKIIDQVTNSITDIKSFTNLLNYKW